MNLRKTAVTLAVAASALAATTLATTESPAGAVPVTKSAGPSVPVPAVYQYSQYFFTLGDHANCRGNVRYSVSAPKGKRGIARITFRSYGFTGDGPAWKKNPRCGLLVSTTKYNASSILDTTYYPIYFGTKPEVVSRDLRIGSGPAILATSTVLLGSPVRVLTSPLGGSTAYTTIP